MAARILSRWLDRDGDEWWEIDGEGYRLAGRSRGSSMSELPRDVVVDLFGPLRPYAPVDADTQENVEAAFGMVSPRRDA